MRASGAASALFASMEPLWPALRGTSPSLIRSRYHFDVFYRDEPVSDHLPNFREYTSGLYLRIDELHDQRELSSRVD